MRICADGAFDEECHRNANTDQGHFQLHGPNTLTWSRGSLLRPFPSLTLTLGASLVYFSRHGALGTFVTSSQMIVWPSVATALDGRLTPLVTSP